MLIKATTGKDKVLLNTDYILDVFDYDKMICRVYTLEGWDYRVEQSELQRWLESEEK